jgi:putative Ca2+/H+ antiporter (TMEM165/GDT1 family)
MLSHWSAALSAVAFFGAATFVWFKRSEAISEQDPVARTWWRVTGVAFASLFFTEWGDPGQIAAAAMTLQFGLPVATWLGGTLAMTTKAVFAMMLGIKLKDRIPQKGLRRVAKASCCVLGLLALYDTVF